VQNLVRLHLGCNLLLQTAPGFESSVKPKISRFITFYLLPSLSPINTKNLPSPFVNLTSRASLLGCCWIKIAGKCGIYATMLTNHSIQQIIEPKSRNEEEREKLNPEDIHQAIDAHIANDAEKVVKESRADLTLENLAENGKHYLFCLLDSLKANKKVQCVVVEWFKVVKPSTL
jgi:hypothetical protein